MPFFEILIGADVLAGAAGTAAAVGAGAAAGGVVAGAAGDAAAGAATDAFGESLGAQALGDAAAGGAIAGAATDAFGESLGAQSLGDAATGSGLATSAGPVAAENAANAVTPSATNTLAQQTLDSGVAPNASQVIAPSAPQGSALSDSINAEMGGGVPATPGTVGSQGLLGNLMQWGKANPRLASGLVQGVGSAVGGIGKGVGSYMTEQQALKNKEALAEWQRNFIQSGNAGGPGVTIPMRPSGSRVLLNSAGQPVYGPNGLIARNMQPGT